MYGDAAAFEVAKIDNVRVKELVKSGDLDGEALKGIALMQERHALYLVSKGE